MSNHEISVVDSLLQESSIRLESIAGIWGPGRLTTLKKAIRDRRLEPSFIHTHQPMSSEVDRRYYATKLSEVARAELRRYAMTPEPPLDKTRLIAWCDLWDDVHAPGTIEPTKIETAKCALGLAPSAGAENPPSPAAANGGAADEDNEPPLKKASVEDIHSTITEVYDYADRQGMKPPNVNKIGAEVRALLRHKGFETANISGQKISNLSRDKRHDGRRLPGGARVYGTLSAFVPPKEWKSRLKR
jgi:hypothetical protein